MSTPPRKKIKLCDKSVSTTTQERCIVCKKGPNPKKGGFSKKIGCGHPIHTKCLWKWRRLLCVVCLLFGTENNEDTAENIVQRLRATLVEAGLTDPSNVATTSRGTQDSDSDSYLSDTSDEDDYPAAASGSGIEQKGGAARCSGIESSNVATTSRGTEDSDSDSYLSDSSDEDYYPAAASGSGIEQAGRAAHCSGIESPGGAASSSRIEPAGAAASSSGTEQDARHEEEAAEPEAVPVATVNSIQPHALNIFPQLLTMFSSIVTIAEHLFIDMILVFLYLTYIWLLNYIRIHYL